jgi:nitrite reductase/ring-hydroxylating ferredoxin subunit
MRPAPRFPFATLPTGWYAVAASTDVPIGGVRSLRYFGTELVLFRTRSGAARLLDAYCPHLGAHLGAGDVRGECLRCPFHGFRFAGDGRCVATGYGTKPPPKAVVPSWHVREHDGHVFAWYDALGRAPHWQIPRLDADGWTPFHVERRTLPSHPQETSENSVDLGHFRVVHGFAGVRETRAIMVEGPVLRTGYAIERVFRVAGRTFRLPARFDVAVHGLGYSLVEGEVPALRTRMRSLVLATPIDAETIDLRIGMAVSRRRSRALTSLVHRAVFWGLRSEVRSDLPIWSRKRYVERPVLADGDGPIAVYRRWCRQFYPQARMAEAGAA